MIKGSRQVLLGVEVDGVRVSDFQSCRPQELAPAVGSRSGQLCFFDAAGDECLSGSQRFPDHLVNVS